MENNEESRAIKFSEIHGSPDSEKAVSKYYRIKIINMIPIAISIILTIILVFTMTSMENLNFQMIIIFAIAIIGVPVFFIPLNIIVSRSSYGKIWYDYLEWYEVEIAQNLANPDFEKIVANKYFVETDYSSNELNAETKKAYDSEVIKIALAVIFLIIGLILYIYLMFNTKISFIALTLTVIAFGAICIYLISDSYFEIRRIRVLGNKSQQ